jgi:hypothetical protein
MGLSSTITALWLTGLVLQALLLLVLATTKVSVRFPMFAAYTVVTFLEQVAGYSLSRHPDAYFLLYVAGEAASIILGVAVVYEIFVRLFEHHGALRKLASRIFLGAVILLGVFGAVVIGTHAPFGKAGIVSALLSVEEAARMFEVGLLMVLFLCSSAFGLHWRQHVFGVGVGLGTFSSIKLIMLALLPHAPSAAGVLNLVLLISLDVTFLIWIGYFLVPERAASSAGLPQRAQLEQWNRAMMELINQ